MKSVNKLLFISFTLVIVFLITESSIMNNLYLSSNHNINLSEESTVDIITPTTAEPYKLSYIHIEGNIPDNWSLTASTYDWCYEKDGVYYIENCTIDAASSPTGCGILIENSKNIYFVIQNCTVTHSVQPPYNTAGIKLIKTCNGTIINNNCSKNANYGIFLTDQCYENKIINNTANNNGAGGIQIYYDCDNNTITNNTINFCSSGIIVETNCNNNVVTNNTLTFCSSGIYLWYYCNENIIANNTAYNNNRGIYLDDNCNDNTITINNIYNNDYGIFLRETCDSNNITDNTIYSNHQHGIYLSNCSYNKISKNIINNNEANGIYLFYSCDENNIIDNTVYSNTQHGIILSKCMICNLSGNIAYNNGWSGNNINENNWSGIFLDDSEDIILYDNNATNNPHGIYLNYTRNSYIGNCSANDNDEGIVLYRSINIVINQSSVNSNSIYGIALINSSFNKIENNAETISSNGIVGIYLLNSNNNTIIGNTINNNYIGIQLIDSYNNTIIPNNFFGNIYDIIYGVLIIDEYIPDDSGGNDESTNDEFPIIIIIVIIIGSIATISSLSARTYIKRTKKIRNGKGKTKQIAYSKEASAKAKRERLLKYEEEQKETAPHISRKPPEKMKGKKKEEIDAKQSFIELKEAERAELDKTEAEMDIDKQKFVCVVHRGKVYGSDIYLCEKCQTFYCRRCAKVLKMRDEKCWNCESEIKIEVTDNDRSLLLEKNVIDLIEELINEKQFLKEFIKTNKSFKDLPQIKKYIFTLITPEELDKINSLNLLIEDKKRFIKEYILLDVKEREEYLKEIFEQ